MASDVRGRGVASAVAAVAFDADVFGRWLRLLLVAFYSDEEVVVVDLLLRRSALIKSNALAHSLGLPERQVRRALEARLVPDCIVERVDEAEGDRTQYYYRISPVCARATARRLEALEGELGQELSESYICPKCMRCYDSLQAMARSVAASSGGGFVFQCQKASCGGELRAVAEDAASQLDRLQRFQRQCQQLVRLTALVKDMPIPWFSKATAAVVPITRGLGSVVVATAGGTAKAEVALVTPASTIEARRTTEVEPRRSEDLEWFRREVLGGPDLLDDAAVVKAEAMAKGLAAGAAAAAAAGDNVMSILKQAATSSNVGDEETRHISTVVVRGRSYPLKRVSGDDADACRLRDEMTDDEYTAYFGSSQVAARRAALCHWKRGRQELRTAAS